MDFCRKYSQVIGTSIFNILSISLFLAFFLNSVSGYSWEAKLTPNMIGSYQHIFKATVVAIQHVEATCPKPTDAVTITFNVAATFKGSQMKSFVYNEAADCGWAAEGLPTPVLEKGSEYYVLSNDSGSRPKFIHANDQNFHDVIAAIEALNSTPHSTTPLLSLPHTPGYNRVPVLSENDCKTAPTDKEYEQLSANQGRKTGINVFGLMCAKGGGPCDITDVCGSLVIIDCNSKSDGPYSYADKRTKQIIVGSTCGTFGAPCHIPAEWTCASHKLAP